MIRTRSRTGWTVELLTNCLHLCVNIYIPQPSMGASRAAYQSLPIMQGDMRPSDRGGTGKGADPSGDFLTTFRSLNVNKYALQAAVKSQVRFMVGKEVVLSQQEKQFTNLAVILSYCTMVTEFIIHRVARNGIVAPSQGPHRLHGAHRYGEGKHSLQRFRPRIAVTQRPHPRGHAIISVHHFKQKQC